MLALSFGFSLGSLDLDAKIEMRNNRRKNAYGPSRKASDQGGSWCVKLHAYALKKPGVSHDSDVSGLSTPD
jgi:hypothetical protein